MEISDRSRLFLRLRLAQGVGPVLFRRLLDVFGTVETVFENFPRQWEAVDGVGPKTAAAIAAVTDDDVEKELAEAEKRGVSILCCEDPDYPPALKNLYDYPPVLYVRGRLTQTDAIAMAIVGARHCTHYGLEQSERFGQLLARAGFTVMSGGARGIDTAAHRGALSANGRTVAVMGCGLATTYPPENKNLFEQIVADDRGALVSELPMRTTVLAGNFPTRNRIISGLSLGVLVVEAAHRSGSLITAREAAEQGRTVFAVPGRVDSITSQGANDLIRGGAVLVQDLDDILEHLGEVGKKLSEASGAAPAEALPAGMTEHETKLMAMLAEGPLGLDEMVRRSGLTTGPVTAAMTMLVIKGLAAQQPGNIFAKKSYPGPRA